MKFLIDNALSLIVADALQNSGHDAVHVRERGLERALDVELVALAETEDRIIVSADTDFGTILASRNKAKPPFILFRRDVTRRPIHQVEILLSTLDGVSKELEDGAIVVIDADRVRIRRLPISDV